MTSCNNNQELTCGCLKKETGRKISCVCPFVILCCTRTENCAENYSSAPNKNIKFSILRSRLFLYLEDAALPYPEYSEEDANLGGGVGELHIRHRHSYTLTSRVPRAINIFSQL
jgi:hypothetical protein